MVLLKGGQVGDSERVAMASSYAASMSTASLADITPQRWVEAFAFEPSSHTSQQPAHVASSRSRLTQSTQRQPRRYQGRFIDELCTHLHEDGNEAMLARMQAHMAGNSKATSDLGES